MASIPDAPPHRILLFLMEQNDLRQSDLLPIFGSRGYVSDVVNGKRAISKTHAKALGIAPLVVTAGAT
jgi:HTH-type transcriptional regulator / antitoxin HigA